MIPPWLTKTLSVPVVKWLVGALILLALFLWVALRRMWLLQRRLVVAQRINATERQYERERRKLRDNQMAKLNEIGVKRELRHIELEKVRHDIRKSEKEGVSAIAEVVNLAFKGKK